MWLKLKGKNKIIKSSPCASESNNNRLQDFLTLVKEGRKEREGKGREGERRKKEAKKEKMLF